MKYFAHFGHRNLFFVSAARAISPSNVAIAGDRLRLLPSWASTSLRIADDGTDQSESFCDQTFSAA
jgi:hypothetical protein